VQTARMYLTENTREQEVEMVEVHAARAALDLRTTQPDLLVFGCTSAGSLGGLSYDRAIAERLASICGCQTVGVISSVTAALDAGGLQKVAVLTPYNEDLTDAVAGSVRESGREVVIAKGMGIVDNVATGEVTPAEVIAFAREAVGDSQVDGLFFSCTNLRSLEAVPDLEREFGLPVVTSNRATLAAVKARLDLAA
ncbi:MAG: hypothetical protein WA888_16930, partial [Burkholderiaceae bacterium]